MSTLYDVAAFAGLELGVPVQALPGDDALQSAADLITGPAKAVQRYLLTLLLEQGTQQYDPLAGCTFLTDMHAGRWRTVADVLQSFHYAQLDVMRQLAQTQLPDDPADETVAEVTPLGVTLTGDVVALRLLMTLQDGSQTAFVAAVGLTLN